MKALQFFPLTFVAGTEGFVLFTLYLALVMAVVYVVAARKRRAAGRNEAATIEPVISDDAIFATAG